MATIAIGDIHGNLKALEGLLEKVLPILNRDDAVVFLGDYIDRGPDSRGCVERILQLREETQAEIVTLLGNHEDWLLRSLADPHQHSWILNLESFSTIESYSPEAASALRTKLGEIGPRIVEKPPLPYDLFFDAVPEAHLAFFRNLKLFHQSPDVICAHAGIENSGVISSSHAPETFFWGVYGFPEEYSGDKNVVYGHHNNAVLDDDGWPLPRIGPNRTFEIDTISHGVLTALRFPDLTVIQSDYFPSE